MSGPIPLDKAEPGDVVAFDSAGPFGRLIQFGQWLRRADRRFRQWHHIAVIYEHIDNDPEYASDRNWLCVQASRRVNVQHLDTIANGRPYIVLRPPVGVDARLVIEQAERYVGIKYGVLSIFSIAFNILTPRWLRLDFRRGGTLICSALGALALHAGGFIHDFPDLYQVTPADLVSSLTPQGD